MSFLYVTWDGPGARYLSSLYFPIFARMNMRAGVLQATYGSQEQIDATAKEAEKYGIEYRGIRVASERKTFDRVGRGLVSLLRQTVQSMPDYSLVVARSLVPAAAIVAIPSRLRRPFVFDADGLPADERIDFGGWRRRDPKYWAARAVETAAMRAADVTLTRTEAARQILESRGGESVIVAPNGSDETRFRPLQQEAVETARLKLGIPLDAAVVIYCGSIGAQYRPDLMSAFTKRLKERGRPVFLIVLTAAVEAGYQIARDAGLEPEQSLVRSVSPEQVPEYLAIADLGLAFRTPSFSQRAVSPIKVGEYLLCGTPVAANLGVGDLDRILTPKLAVVTKTLTRENVKLLADRFLETDFDRKQIRELALVHFSLGQAARGYAHGMAVALENADG